MGGILGESLHALAHRAIAITQPLEYSVHPRVQLLEFLLAQGVDFVGSQARGGRSLKCPAIELFAVRPRPHPRFMSGRISLALQLGNLGERGVERPTLIPRQGPADEFERLPELPARGASG